MFCISEAYSSKKFFDFLLHFLHQSMKIPLYIGDFRWRIGCRIEAGCRIDPTFSVSFILFFHYFCPQYPAFFIWFRVRYTIKLRGFLAFFSWFVRETFKCWHCFVGNSTFLFFSPGKVQTADSVFLLEIIFLYRYYLPLSRLEIAQVSLASPCSVTIRYNPNKFGFCARLTKRW